MSLIELSSAPFSVVDESVVSSLSPLPLDRLFSHLLFLPPPPFTLTPLFLLPLFHLVQDQSRNGPAIRARSPQPTRRVDLPSRSGPVLPPHAKAPLRSALPREDAGPRHLQRRVGYVVLSFFPCHFPFPSLPSLSRFFFFFFFSSPVVRFDFETREDEADCACLFPACPFLTLQFHRESQGRPRSGRSFATTSDASSAREQQPSPMACTSAILRVVHPLDPSHLLQILRSISPFSSFFLPLWPYRL
jgi:hypothetical protein